MFVALRRDCSVIMPLLPPYGLANKDGTWHTYDDDDAFLRMVDGKVNAIKGKPGTEECGNALGACKPINVWPSPHHTLPGFLGFPFGEDLRDRVV